MSEPTSNPFFDAEVATRLAGQILYSRGPVEGSVSGHHKSPHRGSSVEFSEYRNYAPGDDLRRLDWRVFGKTDRFYTKEFEAETNLRCYLVLDTSGSMGLEGPNGKRIDVARRIASTLAYLLVRQGDAVGMTAARLGDTLELPPKRAPSHLQLLFEHIAGLECTGSDSLPQAIHDLAERARRRALIVIFSDFFSDQEALRDALQHLRFRSHDVVVFHLLDRQELNFKFDRPVRFQDLESGASLISEPNLVRDQYLEVFHRYLREFEASCREIEIDYRRILTDEEIETPIANFVIERAGR